MSREVKTLYVAEAEDGIRLDRWFRRRWPHLSHIQVQKMARSGQIRVDGSRVKPEDRLTAGAAVRVPPIPDAGGEDPGRAADPERPGRGLRPLAGAVRGRHGASP